MLSDELIVKIGADLDVLPLQPTSRRELEMLLSRIAGSIRAAQERGATYTEIAIQISASGYPIKRSTLCAALLRHRRNAPGAKQPVRRGETKSAPLRQASVLTDARPAGSKQSGQMQAHSSRARQLSTTVSSE